MSLAIQVFRVTNINFLPATSIHQNSMITNCFYLLSNSLNKSIKKCMEKSEGNLYVAIGAERVNNAFYWTKSAEMSRKTLVWYLHTCILNPLGVFPLIGNKRVKVPKEHSTKGIEIATTSGMTRYTSIHDLWLYTSLGERVVGKTLTPSPCTTAIDYPYGLI